ncbi:MAG: serine hydrolase [Gammaproteobacteria bacterium]
MKNLALAVCVSMVLFTGGAAAEDRLAHVSLQSAGRHSVAEPAASAWDDLDPDALRLRSASVMVVDRAGHVVYSKDARQPRPIASITKLMTAMVILDSGLSLKQPITITKADRDLIKLTGSRLRYGATLPRGRMLRLALLASENRAANALARTYPGGRKAFVAAMNRKARALGMHDSHFAGPAGLDPATVASARDLVKMIRAAQKYPLIRQATTSGFMTVRPYKHRGPLRFGNTNRLVRRASWDIGLSKTGYINEAGRCLVMEAAIADKSLYIVLLDSFGKLTPFGDSNRLRRWIESSVR